MKQKKVVRLVAIVGVVGLMLGALLPVLTAF